MSALDAQADVLGQIDVSLAGALAAAAMPLALSVNNPATTDASTSLLDCVSRRRIAGAAAGEMPVWRERFVVQGNS